MTVTRTAASDRRARAGSSTLRPPGPAGHDDSHDEARHEGREDRRLGTGLVVGGAVGLGAAFALAVEGHRLLTDPEYVPTCSINPVLTCQSVMQSPQAELFGFPNPFLGLVGFTVVLVTGVLLAGGVRLPGWFWGGLQVGVSAAALFVHWLIASSLYRIGALCPWCMVVWAVTIPLFVAVSLRNLTALGDRLPPRVVATATAVRRQQSVLVTVWFLAVATLVAERFWWYRSTLLG